MYLASYYRIPVSEASVHLWTFTCVRAHKYIVWDVTGTTLTKQFPVVRLIDGGRSLTSKMICITESGVIRVSQARVPFAYAEKLILGR